jgi:hypothetical protein
VHRRRDGVHARRLARARPPSRRAVKCTRGYEKVRPSQKNNTQNCLVPRRRPSANVKPGGLASADGIIIPAFRAARRSTQRKPIARRPKVMSSTTRARRAEVGVALTWSRHSVRSPATLRTKARVAKHHGRVLQSGVVDGYAS